MSRAPPIPPANRRDSPKPSKKKPAVVPAADVNPPEPSTLEQEVDVRVEDGGAGGDVKRARDRDKSDKPKVF
jgi:hypothetical protein